MSALSKYIDAWVRADAVGVAATLTDDCVVVECYGPVYHGRSRVEEWCRTWFDAGGMIHSWVVMWHRSGDAFEVAEWRFDCTWQGHRTRFEGCSVAVIRDGRIARLREYQTSAPLYDWEGQWR